MEINRFDYLSDDNQKNKLSRILEISDDLSAFGFNTGLYGRPMSEEIDAIIMLFRSTLRNSRIKKSVSNQEKLDNTLSELESLLYKCVVDEEKYIDRSVS